MVNMILNLDSGKKVAVNSSNIVEMYEGDYPLDTVIVLSRGRYNQEYSEKHIIVKHSIQEVFDKIHQLDRGLF